MTSSSLTFYLFPWIDVTYRCSKHLFSVACICWVAVAITLFRKLLLWASGFFVQKRLNLMIWCSESMVGWLEKWVGGSVARTLTLWEYNEQVALWYLIGGLKVLDSIVLSTYRRLNPALRLRGHMFLMRAKFNTEYWLCLILLVQCKSVRSRRDGLLSCANVCSDECSHSRQHGARNGGTPISFSIFVQLHLLSLPGALNPRIRRSPPLLIRLPPTLANNNHPESTDWSCQNRDTTFHILPEYLPYSFISINKYSTQN